MSFDPRQWPWSAYDRWKTTPPERIEEEEEYDKYQDDHGAER